MCTHVHLGITEYRVPKPKWEFVWNNSFEFHLVYHFYWCTQDQWERKVNTGAVILWSGLVMRSSADIVYCTCPSALQSWILLSVISRQCHTRIWPNLHRKYRMWSSGTDYILDVKCQGHSVFLVLIVYGLIYAYRMWSWSKTPERPDLSAMNSTSSGKRQVQHLDC